jgi:hypothetical protein
MASLADRLARITTTINIAKRMITDFPSNAIVLSLCTNKVADLLLNEPGAAEGFADMVDLPSADWHITCARAILGILPGCTYAYLEEGACIWVDFHIEAPQLPVQDDPRDNVQDHLSADEDPQ